MADHFWKSMPAAPKSPHWTTYTASEGTWPFSSRRHDDSDAQWHLAAGIPSRGQRIVDRGSVDGGWYPRRGPKSRWLSKSTDRGLRGFELARNPGLSNTTEYGAGEFPLPTKPDTRNGTQSSSKPLSVLLSQKTEERYPDLSKLTRGNWRRPRGNGISSARGHWRRPRGNGIRLLLMGIRLLVTGIKRRLKGIKLGSREIRWYLKGFLLRAELDETRNIQENAASCDQLNSEIERLQRKQQEMGSGKERKTKTPIEPLMGRPRPDSRSRPDSKMEAPRASGRFNLDRTAQGQMSEVLNAWTPPEHVPSLRDLESGRFKPLMVDVTLPGLTPGSTGGSQAGAGTSRLKELQERLQSRTPENPTLEAETHTWRKQPVRSAIISNYKKNTDRRHHRHRREDWTAVQC